MQALILVAGRGSRLGHLTDDKPKALVSLMGRPLLAWQMNALRDAGLSPLALVTGYQAHLFEGYGDTHIFNPAWDKGNMVCSFLEAATFLSAETTLVSYGDIFYPSSVVKRLAAASGDIAITYDPNWLPLWRARAATPDDATVSKDAETFFLAEDGNLTAIGEKVRLGENVQRLEDIKGQYMGLLKFTPRGFQAMQRLLTALGPARVKSLAMTDALSLFLQQGGRIAAVPLHKDESWGEIDVPEDIALYEKDYFNDAVMKKYFPYFS